MRPRATAAGFFPSDSGVGTVSSISPVAILATMTAQRMASAGRFSPLGPLGIPALKFGYDGIQVSHTVIDTANVFGGNIPLARIKILENTEPPRTQHFPLHLEGFP